MTKQFKFLIGIVWLFTFSVSMAQTTTSNGTKVEGSPYLNESFVAGEISFGKSKSKVPVRYNIHKDEMEYMQKGVTYVLDPAQNIKKVHIGEATFIYTEFEFRGKPMKGFLELLDSGKVTLLSKKVVTFDDAKRGGSPDGTDRPARYYRLADVFYYKIGNGEMKKVENIKTMIASLPDKQDELSQFAKKEKISPRKEKELVKLAQYYNSLDENITIPTGN
jgi:hypothetical protein